MPGIPGIFVFIRSMIKAITDTILSVAFPQQCHVCGGSVESRSDGVACSSCWSATQMFADGEPRCQKCGNLLTGSRSSSADRCHRCDEHQYDLADALGVYEAALAASVLHLKKIPMIPKRIESELNSAIGRGAIPEADVIVPVPLSAKRQLERGFNQAEKIAERIARITKIPVDSHTLTRKLHTPLHRAAMDRKARELTVKNAFQVLRPKLVEGRSILLVDDIFTSGATASNCAETLKKNGADKVNVFTLARAVNG